VIERGNYRSIFCALVDGPDFQAFTPGAKLVFYTLKMTLGPSGIDVVPALVATLVERTGADTPKIEKALKELDAAGWVKRERNVVWIVDGLAHEPSLNIRSNSNHRTSLAKHVNGLPRLAIVELFRAHYGLSTPPVEMPSPLGQNTAEDGREMPSKMVSKSPSRSRERERDKGKGRRKTSTISASGDAELSGSGRTGRPTWLTPFADAWRAKYGGEMAAGTAVRSLRKLVDEYGSPEVERRWLIYTAATPPEYANAPKFAATWGRWDKAQLTAMPGRANLGFAPDVLTRAVTLWPLYKAAGLLTRTGPEVLKTRGEALVEQGHYSDFETFRAEIAITKPWELADIRIDGIAINELAKRLAPPVKVAS
jgi:hypothetical protein